MRSACRAPARGAGACLPNIPDRIFGVKLQKLDDLLLNSVVAFEAHRIKGVTPHRAAETAK